jgi:cytidylate kinase
MIEIKKARVIAIDGPSGSGKSTIAKIVAEKLGLTYLDTGAMFRALGYILEKNEIDYGKENLTETETSKTQKILNSLDFQYGINPQTLIEINGENLTETIRMHEVSSMASKVSKFAVIRDFLKEKQREIAKNKPSVLEGRDIGTVIFPNAALKIFLTADPLVRAERRYAQLIEKDASNKDRYSVEQILADIESRDAQDKNRDIAPLVKAQDAIEIDTSKLSMNEVENLIINYYHQRQNLFS